MTSIQIQAIVSTWPDDRRARFMALVDTYTCEGIMAGRAIRMAWDFIQHTGEVQS